MRIAVAGMGAMGNQHSRAWQKIPGVELAAIVAPEPIQSVAGNLVPNAAPLELRGVPIFEDLKPVLADASIDAVDLCIPTFAHAGAVLEALATGKHVLVEKPMALVAADCQAMIEAATRAKRMLMVGHVIRFWPEYQPLIEAVRSGSLGKLRGLALTRQCAAPTWSPWFRDAAKSGGGAFDLLIHDVDLCIALFGAPAAVSSSGDGDFLSANLYYPKIPSVTIAGGWHECSSYPFVMSYQARFEGGTLEFASDAKTVRLYQPNGPVFRPQIPRYDAYQAELAYFAQCVRDSKPALECPMEHSALAVRLTRFIADARSQAGQVVAWGDQ